jgi:hypothetical protein
VRKLGLGNDVAVGVRPQAAIDTLKERSGRWFGPGLAAAVVTLDKTRSLWRDCLPGDPVEETRSAILRLHPKKQDRLSAQDVDGICEVFADVVDAKSPSPSGTPSGS